MTLEELIVRILSYMAEHGMLDDLIEKYGDKEEREKNE